jgi:3-hydroxyisobutyrate dehydrogenase-like beta-hydroxyacid dehydrogenase
LKILRTAREVALESDVVVTGLPKPPHVRDVFHGKDGLLAGMEKGGLIARLIIGVTNSI